ncbi:MAG: tetratricopeptide repeat protein [Bacteroidales bacterium]|nr:tetratricopeptide repeat protein [Bacteroidales bacterium]
MKQTLIAFLALLFLNACNFGSVKDQSGDGNQAKTKSSTNDDSIHQHRDSFPVSQQVPDAEDADGIAHLEQQAAAGQFNAYEDYIKLGLDLYRNKEYSAALEKMDFAVQSDPMHPKAYYYRGQIYVDISNFKAAKEDFLKVTSMVEDDHRAWNFLGATQTHGAENDLAVESYSKAITLDPNNALYYFNRGSSLGQLGKLEEALVDFDKAVELGFNTAGIYNNRANTRYMLGDFQGAIADFSRSMEIDPKSMAPYANRGIAYLYIRDTIRACADWQRALEMGHPLVKEYLELYCK